MIKNTLFLAVLCLALTGCKGIQHNVMVVTGTVLGVSITENPATQFYEARLGYARSEFAFVPGDTNNPGTVPDVLMEIRMENILKGGLVYQRLAVGSNAVMQPGAALLFSKDAKGSVDPKIVEMVLKQTPAPDTQATSEKLPLAQAYQQAADKGPWDAVAKKLGYASFGGFLTNPTLTVPDVFKMKAELQAVKVLP